MKMTTKDIISGKRSLSSASAFPRKSKIGKGNLIRVFSSVRYLEYP